LITGGNGEVGSTLAKLLSLEGVEVVVSSRNPRASNQIKWELNSELMIDERFTIEGVVHCAFDAKKPSVNINGARTLGNYTKNQRIPLINISSVLAQFSDISYGETKRSIENEIRNLGGFNLRIGVVSSNPPISNLQVLSRLSEKLSILPFPGASTRVYETPIEMLKKRVVELLSNPEKTVERDLYVVTQSRPSFAQLIRQSTMKKDIRVIDLPIVLVSNFLWLPAQFSKKIESIRQSFMGNALLKKSSGAEEGWSVD
jgi:hypothetical protein